MTDWRPPDDAAGDQDGLRDLLAGTRAVLLDFDGPVCDLFGRTSTAGVADEVKAVARRHWGRLDPEVESCDDSHDILRRLADMYERSAPRLRDRTPLTAAEERVTALEAEAATHAAPAPHIGGLVELLRGRGIPLVVVSNNAEAPIRRYLGRPDVGLTDAFGAVFGRDPHDARLMKPDPHCVNRALAFLSLPASACLLVGDQLTDLKAARAAGTCFLGHTTDPERAEDMRQGGANAVVSSHLEIVERLPGPVRQALTVR
ncbi:HAD family hydrolase [Streptomyces sp. NPDC026672]|uniref:HAD family hydrolase n=1 Tax=unclassified Streptomyces TaxID=2593676 RepID=UPI0034069749